MNDNPINEGQNANFNVANIFNNINGNCSTRQLIS